MHRYNILRGSHMIVYQLTNFPVFYYDAKQGDIQHKIMQLVFDDDANLCFLARNLFVCDDNLLTINSTSRELEMVS